MKSLHHDVHNEGAIRALDAELDWCQSLLVEKRDQVCFSKLMRRRWEILDQIDADPECRLAMLLYTCGTLAELKRDQLVKKFGRHMADLVRGITTMDAISVVRSSEGPASGVEDIRKMLIAMIDDVRVVLVQLACQLDILREAKDLEEEHRRQLGQATLDVFAPLANRLGIWQFKWELEDYALRYTNPQAYKTLARQLAEKRVDREQYIESFKSDLAGMLAQSNIPGEVAGRPKHIYSIYRKMQLKGLDLDSIHDVRAVRCLVDGIADCYSVLGLVHTRWSPVVGEFDDYIATPKHNGYQSIHTAVIGPQGKVVEVQIRTHEMHEANELGVAAHWRYKENRKQDGAMDSKILWLRQLLDWKQELGDSGSLYEQFRNEVDDQRVYVFTPRGKVIDLPRGATPLDFAYAIHTDIGHQCRGAKIGGRMVPLTHRLENGEQVDILTVRSGTPSRDWLNPSLGYVCTQRARSRIQRWFKTEDFEINLSAGRSVLERELDRLGAPDTAYETLAEQSGYRKVDEFLAAIGSGDLKLSQAVSSLRPSVERKTSWQNRPAVDRRDSQTHGMEIQGVGNLLTHSAACCNPLPGDEIIGYITQGRGITIHRQDCGNILRLDEEKQARLISVQWGHRDAEVFPVDLEIKAIDRKGLLHDVSGVLKDLGVNVLSTATQSNEKSHTALMRIRVEVGDVNQLSQLLNKLVQVPNVTDARRLAG